MQEYTFEFYEIDIKFLGGYASYLDHNNREFLYKGHTTLEIACKNDQFNVVANLSIPVGVTKIIYKNYKLKFELIRDPLVVGIIHCASKHETLFLTFECESKEIACRLLHDFISDAKIYDNNNSSATISRRIYRENRGWIFLSKIPKRNMSTIYFDEEKKNHIVADLMLFYSSRDDYKQFGIPYSRKYLFEGPPGVGKTSLIHALASMFNKNIELINFNHQLDDAALMNSLISLDGILVLEDIDSLFDKDNKSSNTEGISFSGLLNILDGFGTKSGLVVFMTTNNFSKLENCFLRPGRIDYIMHFTTPNKKQMQDIFENILSNQKDKFNKFYSYI